MGRRYRTVREAAIGDVGRAIAMATGGVLAFAPVEYALTLWAYPGPVDGKLRLAALTATLALWWWGLLVLGLAAVMLAARALGDPHRLGLFRAAEPLDERLADDPVHGVRRGVPQLWGVLATAGLVGGIVQIGAAYAITHYKEPQLTAVVIAVLALLGLAIAIPLHRLTRSAAELGARTLAPVLGVWNPLGRWRAAAGALTVLLAIALGVVWKSAPGVRSVMPVRMIISAAVTAIGCGLGAKPGRWRLRSRRRTHAAAAAGIAFVVMTMTLWKWGADLETKYVAITASPAMDHLIELVRFANDLDRDGFGSVLGENDCAPLDASIHPGARDIPDDGIDQNCDGHDFSRHALAMPTGPTLPVPPEFKKPWNVLLITVDTLRYDSTTFGGYADGPKHRNTTPRLAEFVKKSVSFTFCNAPSAGTMASIPAIITSKFFHSGIALDEHVAPGMPPRLKPENTTLPEIMKRAGYYTGVIASHEYWNDWGMDQGVDDYDNSIGKTPDPFRVAADKVTDHALAWITRQQGKKWFLWAHYIDPHGRYVAHPDVVDYGSSEPDLYDAEVQWTDQQIGRLFDELVRLPSNDNTIIILTSDHGDSMGEHNVPVGTHGTALYRELQHVPMIFYIPNNQPRTIGGAVSNLDIVPTIAELTGIDVHDLTFEGKSEVPAIFYGKEDHSRVVFAETNAPSPQRAAISESWKLIYYMNSNVYELYNLKTDPWEHENLAPRHPPAFEEMKTQLDDWLERVVFSRDADFNQANRKIKDVLLTQPEEPQHPTPGLSLDGGKIEIAGWSVDPATPLVPGGKVDFHVYFRVKQRTALAYKFQLVAGQTRSPTRVTADGFFPSDHWRVGDLVRDRYEVTLPATLPVDGLPIALYAFDAANAPITIDLGKVGSSGSAQP